MVGVVLGDVAGQQVLRAHVVDWPVEEALDLVGVQVDGQDPVRARGLEEVGDQSRRDRLAAAVFLVLAGVGIERQDRGDPLGATALERVDHDQLFHQPLVQRRGMGLQHERVATADRFIEADEDLAVGEVACGLGGDRDIEILGDLLGQFRVRATGEEHQILAVVGPLGAHSVPSPVGVRYRPNGT